MIEAISKFAYDFKYFSIFRFLIQLGYEPFFEDINENWISEDYRPILIKWIQIETKKQSFK